MSDKTRDQEECQTYTIQPELVSTMVVLRSTARRLDRVFEIIVRSDLNENGANKTPENDDSVSLTRHREVGDNDDPVEEEQEEEQDTRK